MSTNDHFLSVIVPIYKQEKTIKADLKNIISTLDRIRYDYEIIAVVDGTKTDKSYKISKSIKNNHLKVCGYKKNHGKGYAVRFGMARTKGDYIAFIDSGMEIDPNGISMLLEHLEWYSADVIVGSKNHPASQINYPLQRKIISFGAHIIARYLLDINVTDTQTGIKIFKRKVLNKVLPRLIVKSYAFDLEVLTVANYLGYKKIYEAPIKLKYDTNAYTHAIGLKVIRQCLVDALAIFYRLKILHYYSDSNQRKWIFDKDLQMRVNIG